jgi:hypothetical protein
MADHAAFVASACLDADTHHLGAGEFGRQTPPTHRRIVDLPAFDTAVNRDVELGFRCIYSGRSANLCHLRRPCLVERTMCSGNHPGPMKALARSCYVRAKHGSGRVRSDRQPPCRGWPSAAGHSFRNVLRIIDLAITRAGLKPAPTAHVAGADENITASFQRSPGRSACA